MKNEQMCNAGLFLQYHKNGIEMIVRLRKITDKGEVVVSDVKTSFLHFSEIEAQFDEWKANKSLVEMVA